MVKKILIIFGTRPEAIKLAPVIKVLKKKFKISVCSTGQHKDLLDEILIQFDISRDYNLKLMTKSKSLSSLSSNLFEQLEKIIIKEKPNMIIVQGDTTSALIAGMVSFYHNIPLSHIEAGLRTYDLNAPFPEEMNRKFLTTLTSLHFAPTNIAKNNLIKEGINKKQIFITGNTVVDSLNFILKKIHKFDFSNYLKKTLPFINNKVSKCKILYVTGHRRENFDGGLERICKSILKIKKNFKNVIIVFSLHPNPKAKNTVMRILNNKSNIFLIKPQDYINNIKLIKMSYFIISDSGGLQEESPTLKKPILITRVSTERMEIINSGLGKLVGSNINKIFNESKKLLTNKTYYQSMISKSNPYGNGKASQKIYKIIKESII